MPCVTEKRIGRAPSNQDIATFLSISLDGEFGQDGRDSASLWSCTRNAMLCLGKSIVCRWEWCKEHQELGVLVLQFRSDDNTIVNPSARGLLERTLKAAVYFLYVETLKHKPDQGKAFELTSKWDASNHFLTGGSFTHFTNWRFIHHARLNCIPLNRAVRHGNQDKRCRKCGYSNETLPHILCSCKPHSRAWQLHHNSIQNSLVKAIAPRLREISVNCTIPSCNLMSSSPTRPRKRSSVSMSWSPLRTGPRPFMKHELISWKSLPPCPLANTLRVKGYEVQMDALIIGALGA
ncbi:uncharacterized protein LOC128823378 [Malaclemys terrapin pileata]|uniref:uncharacterized protein LOC128823378 n=1 Tax=Malaclemys terrapin pileata TaxID=2991368 RepID=UPI0023A79408|nr:uncharacterized protein LOC128823378 [Malaclemys terrapin pileata]